MTKFSALTESNQAMINQLPILANKIAALTSQLSQSASAQSVPIDLPPQPSQPPAPKSSPLAIVCIRKGDEWKTAFNTPWVILSIWLCPLV